MHRHTGLQSLFGPAKEVHGHSAQASDAVRPVAPIRGNPGQTEEKQQSEQSQEALRLGESPSRSSSPRASTASVHVRRKVSCSGPL